MAYQDKKIIQPPADRLEEKDCRQQQRPGDVSQITIPHIRDFHPDHIFDCGQAFRWERQENGSYTGIAGTHIANIQFIPYAGKNTENSPAALPGGEGRLIITNASMEDFQSFWKRYLDLDRDYSKIKATLAEKDPVLRTAIGSGQGIRLLQQDKWETLLSFIISQNNHIPRIKKCIESLCRNFGEKAGSYGGRDYYTFPLPETLASLEPEDLSVCRLGYRAKYLIKTARQAAEDGLAKLEAAGEPDFTSQQAFDYVSSFAGVGPKVANCILLFSMGKYDRFPIDVWVKKVMEQLYGIKNPKHMQEFAEKRFGSYSGFAQQYLFYHIRESAGSTNK